MGVKLTVETIFCTHCGEKMSVEAAACPKCAHPNKAAGYSASGAPKSRIVAGVLALLLGGIGVHKFYLRKVGLGIVYILFCWTFVPSIIAFVEGIIYLVQDDKTFSLKQGVTVTPS
jgi:TM2 domain-containing membrane protein YozV